MDACVYGMPCAGALLSSAVASSEHCQRQVQDQLPQPRLLSGWKQPAAVRGQPGEAVLPATGPHKGLQGSLLTWKVNCSWALSQPRSFTLEKHVY